MIVKKLTKLVGLTEDEFIAFQKSGQIQAQAARLIPTIKAGDEMALSSTFLSSIRLVKEFRDEILKEIKFSRSGKHYYFTEVCFPDLGKLRLDGMIVQILKGKVAEAVFFEMKNRNNKIEKAQIEGYLNLAKSLGVQKLVTISNEFVRDSSFSPISLKVPKKIDLLHFSWTYLLTKGQILLFDNETNIEDEDQVEIMREVLDYLEHPVSGVSGFTKMQAGWKEVAEKVHTKSPLKPNDKIVEEALLSWHEEEKDMALLLSRKLGVLVKTRPSSQASLKEDQKKLVEKNLVEASIDVKNAVSRIKIEADFERRTLAFSVKVNPPMDKGTVARVTWISNQLDYCKKQNETAFRVLENALWIEANIKHARLGLRFNSKDLDQLKEESRGREIQEFTILYVNSLGAKFSSTQKFIEILEQSLLDFYQGLVQNLSNWKRPAPKLEKQEE